MGSVNFDLPLWNCNTNLNSIRIHDHRNLGPLMDSPIENAVQGFWGPPQSVASSPQSVSSYCLTRAVHGFWPPQSVASSPQSVSSYCLPLTHHPNCTCAHCGGLPRIWACEICGKPHSKHDNLHMHLSREHPGGQCSACGSIPTTYDCPTCAKIFLRADDFNKHIVVKCRGPSRALKDGK